MYIQNCIGLRKKILELGVIISVRNSSAEAFCFAVRHQRKIDGSTVLFLRKFREWRLQQTVYWNASFFNSVFNLRENITKQLFCFQLKWKVRPKKSSKSLNSSFLSATSAKKPSSRNRTALHPGLFFERERPTSNQLHVFFTSLWPGFNNTLKVSQASIVD